MKLVGKVIGSVFFIVAVLCFAFASAAWAAKEAPELAELVKLGKLPPVEERLPDAPLVVEPVEEIGRYGGTLNRTYFGTSDAAGWERLTREPLIGWDREYVQLRPNVARAWEVLEDGRVFVFHLRKGMKWSDGTPFTADDILFWYEDIILNKELNPVPPSLWSFKGELLQVEKIDDYTVKISFSEPYGWFPYQLAEFGNIYAPKHYLKQFHINYADQEELERQTREAGFSTWNQLFTDKNSAFNNPDYPVITAWKVDARPSARFVASRNPYYWKVDPEGNQLPYIDRVSQQLISDTELMVMKAISGEIDFQIRHFHNRWLDFPLLMQNAESGKYRVLLWNSDYAGAAVLYFNLNTKNPVLRPLFNDSRFRRALSLAIDRDEINELVFLGAGAPQQPFLTPGSPAYDESTARRYTEYDPARANELLDEIGLTQRDSAGYRLSPDGQPIVINIEVRSGVSQEQVTTAELFADYWSKVGIRAVVKAGEKPLETRKEAGEHDVMMQDASGGMYPCSKPTGTSPFSPPASLLPSTVSGISQGQKR